MVYDGSLQKYTFLNKILKFRNLGGPITRLGKTFQLVLGVPQPIHVFNQSFLKITTFCYILPSSFSFVSFQINISDMNETPKNRTMIQGWTKQVRYTFALHTKVTKDPSNRVVWFLPNYWILSSPAKLKMMWDLGFLPVYSSVSQEGALIRKCHKTLLVCNLESNNDELFHCEQELTSLSEGEV